MGRKFGLSFSWKRAVGISGMKNKISRQIGIPLTQGGRQRAFTENKFKPMLSIVEKQFKMAMLISLFTGLRKKRCTFC